MMPASVGLRRGDLLAEARRCYDLRRAADAAGYVELASDYQAMGDSYRAYAHALIREWQR